VSLNNSVNLSCIGPEGLEITLDEDKLLTAPEDYLNEVKKQREDFKTLSSILLDLNSKHSGPIHDKFTELFNNTSNHLLQLKGDAQKHLASEKQKEKEASSQRKGEQRGREAKVDIDQTRQKAQTLAGELITVAKKYHISDKIHSPAGIQRYGQACKQKSIEALINLRREMEAQLQRIESLERGIEWSLIGSDPDAVRSKEACHIIKQNIKNLIGIVNSNIDQKQEERPEKEATARIKAFEKYTEETTEKMKKANTPTKVIRLEEQHKIENQTVTDLIKDS